MGGGGSGCWSVKNFEFLRFKIEDARLTTFPARQKGTWSDSLIAYDGKQRDREKFWKLREFVWGGVFFFRNLVFNLIP